MLLGTLAREGRRHPQRNRAHLCPPAVASPRGSATALAYKEYWSVNCYLVSVIVLGNILTYIIDEYFGRLNIWLQL